MTARDLGFERAWLDNLALETGRAYGADAEPLLSQLWARLERGDAVFGDEFMRRDNLGEGLEEGADYVAYLLMDCEVARDSDNYEDAPELFRAAMLITAADDIVRGVKARRRG